MRWLAATFADAGSLFNVDSSGLPKQGTAIYKNNNQNGTQIGKFTYVDDAAIRNNRLALLKRLADRLGSVAAIEHLST